MFNYPSLPLAAVAVLPQSRGTVGAQIAICDKKSDDDAICSRCGSNGDTFPPDGLHLRRGVPPVCVECIEAPYRSDWMTAVVENAMKQVERLIRKCGKTADVQLKLPHDAHLMVAAFVFRRRPWSRNDWGWSVAQHAPWTKLCGGPGVPWSVADGGNDYSHFKEDPVGCGCCSECPCCGCSHSYFGSSDSASDMTDAVSASDID